MEQRRIEQQHGSNNLDSPADKNGEVLRRISYNQKSTTAKGASKYALGAVNQKKHLSDQQQMCVNNPCQSARNPLVINKRRRTHRI